MIYKDKQAHLDREDVPAPRFDYQTGREEQCLNCKHYQSFHLGWACDEDGAKEFSKLTPNFRYLTASMCDNQTSVKSDIDWRDFRNAKADECPCGILRSICTYHKD